MAVIESWVRCDLKKPVQVQMLGGNLFSMDNQGNKIGVEVFDNGAAATISGTVSGSVIRADGATVAVTGTLSGNKASIVLPQAAYAVPGFITIVIKLTNGSVITTLAAVTGIVYRSSTSTAVDPGTIIPDISELIAEIETAVASIPADYSSLWTSLAPTFSTSTAYNPGQFVTYDGKLYICTAAHSGSWNASHFSVTNIGGVLSKTDGSLYAKNPMSPLLFESMSFRKGATSGGSETVVSYANPTHVADDFTTFNSTTAIGSGSGYMSFALIEEDRLPVLSSGGSYVLYLLVKSNKQFTFTARLSTGTTWGTALSVAQSSGDVLVNIGYNVLAVQFNYNHAGTDGRNEYRYLVLNGENAYSDLDMEVSLLKGDNFMGWLLKGFSTRQPMGPLYYTQRSVYFDGSSTGTVDTNAREGYCFDGFDSVTAVSGNTFGVSKEIAGYLRPPVLASGSAMTVAVNFELAPGITSVHISEFLIGTGTNWNPNNFSYVLKRNFYVHRGWNRITLPVVGTAGSATQYKYVTITSYSAAELQTIKSAYVFLDESAAASETAYSAFSAGFDKLNSIYTPITGYTGTLSSGNISWSTTDSGNVCGFANGTSASGQCWARIAWDIKDLFGKGYVLYFDITNSNGADTGFSSSNWSWNEWHLSKNSTSWGTNAIVNFSPSTYGGSATKAASSFSIDIDEAFSTVNPSDYTHIYLLVAAFKNSPSSVPSATLGISVKARMKSWDVWATRLLGFDQSNYYTKAQVDEMIGEPAHNDVNLLFWGDSLTSGAGGDGTTYPDVCAGELNKTYKNCGVGGESANTIAARQGGNAIYIPAGAINGTYAYNAFTDVFGGIAKPLRQGDGSGSGNKIYIDGQECTLSVTQTSSTSTDAVYTISGYTGGSSSVPQLARFAGSAFTGDVVIIWVGQNGSTVGNDTSVTARMTIIDSMIAHIPHKKYIVLGLSSGTESGMATEDAQMLAKYGNNFFPTRKMLVNYGLTINGLTPTSQDETDIAAGKVPDSLHSDSTHLNAYGYTAIGKLLADKIRSLGYV